MKKRGVQSVLYECGLNFKPSGFFRTLDKRFSVQKVSQERLTKVYYDTFSSDMYHAETEIFSEQRDGDQTDSLRLTGIHNTGISYQLDAGARDKKIFASDLAPGVFRDRLKKIIKVRALIPVFTIEENRSLYHILNNDQKKVVELTICRLRLIEKRVHRLNTRVELKSIRGYNEELIMVQKKLEQVRATRAGSLFRVADQKLKRSHDYTDKVNLALTAQMSTMKAFREIMQQLVTILQQNTPGILHDIDTEFLHDYRVAVRKIRTLVSEFPYVFDDQIFEKARTDFKFIGQKSNRLRDTDVYLLEKQWYIDKLPQEQHDHLEEFFDYIQVDRKTALKDFKLFLNSEDYKQKLDYWVKFISRPSQVKGLRLGAFAANLLHRRFQKIIKKGKKIDNSSPDEQLHRLRIDGKKFRYHLEFFGSLFSDKQVKAFLKKMKALQDCLGTFNDRSMQIIDIGDFIEKHPQLNTHTTGALHLLLKVIEQEKNTERERFKQVFDEFSHDRTVKMARKLFAEVSQ